MRIVIIMAPHVAGTVDRYDITEVARFWEADGHEVVYTFGHRDFRPGDVGILHVGLTDVPTEYMEIADKYPVALNRRVTTIRKSTYSRQRLDRDDAYTGRVIVKSDLNWAGVPEYRLDPARLESIPERFRFRTPHSYAVFETLSEVPGEVFDCDELIVEKFLPEEQGGRFHARIYVFLGESGRAYRIDSPGPIVKGESGSRTRVEPHDEILETRRRFGIDYGKIDYGIHEGQVVVYDINKTTGVGPKDEYAEDRHRTVARGLYDYVDGPELLEA